MSKPTTPFSKEELLPQEEVLEIARKKGALKIGIPKEIQHQEKRVCLTPDAIAALVAHGHEIIIESDAGLGSQFDDLAYSNAGAQITQDVKQVFGCPMILKVAPASMQELEMMNPETVLLSALQLKTQSKEYFIALQKKKITAIAFEFIKDDTGEFPAVCALSEIAGKASIHIASELMTSGDNKTGLLFGNISGVPPTEVVILGAGTVGTYAAKAAIGLGANVRMFDNSITRLKSAKTIIGHEIYTSTVQPKYLAKALRRCDVAIGALRGKNRAPVVVSEEMVRKMKNGAIIIDVSIDMGGCFETSEVTSHNKPWFVKHGVTHYGVPNIPARYARTASLSLSNIFTPYIIQIANDGGIEHSIRVDSGLKNGLYFYHGILTNKTIGEWFDLPYSDTNLLIF